MPPPDGGVLLRLLNGFQLTCGDAPANLPNSAQVLLAFLALHEGPLERRYIAGSLWTDSSEQHSNGSLRAMLWRLTRSNRPFVEVAGTTLALARDVKVDVREMSALVRRLAHDGGALPDAPPEALGLDGELLPGWYQDWVLVERERVRMRQLHGLELLCERLTRADRYFEAVEAGQAAVRSEPLRESARRLLIAAHLAAGNQTEALRQYELFRRALRRELGLLPSAHMDEVIRGLRGGPDFHAPITVR